MGFFSFFTKEKKETLEKGLSKTKESLFSKLSKAVLGKSRVDDDVLDNLEEILISADVGWETTVKIIERLQARIQRDKYLGTDELNTILRDEISSLMTENVAEERDDFSFETPHKPYVIMVVGVNGVGKTTTIGKLAHQHTAVGSGKKYRRGADRHRRTSAQQGGTDERALQNPQGDAESHPRRPPRGAFGPRRLNRPKRHRAGQAVYRGYAGQRAGTH